MISIPDLLLDVDCLLITHRPRHPHRHRLRRPRHSLPHPHRPHRLHHPRQESCTSHYRKPNHPSSHPQWNR